MLYLYNYAHIYILIYIYTYICIRLSYDLHRAMPKKLHLDWGLGIGPAASGYSPPGNISMIRMAGMDWIIG